MRAAGYSLVELLIAIALVGAFSAGVFGLVRSSHETFAAQPEAADMQQRLRVAVDVLHADMLMAGAGAYTNTMSGPLHNFFAPVLPYRIGADAPGSFRADAITIIYVRPTATQTTLAAGITSTSAAFAVNQDRGCPIGKPACGFAAGDTALVYDVAGHFDTFTVTGGSGGGGTMTPDNPPPSGETTYLPGAKMVAAVVRTYALKSDAAGQRFQLVSYDGGAGADAPVVDHVVALRFDYFGDPRPPALSAPAGCDPVVAACTTYGPPPPDAGVQTTAYPPGENCAFARDGATGQAVPRGAVLGSGSGPVLMSPSQFTDGPWCPDEASPNRFDLDLLRIRTIAIMLRVESAIDALRGPASALFARGGTATTATMLLPDQEVRFDVSPRNMSAGR